MLLLTYQHQDPRSGRIAQVLHFVVGNCVPASVQLHQPNIKIALFQACGKVYNTFNLEFET